MQIRIGYELAYECPQPTPMVLMLNVHHTRVTDIVVPDGIHTDPAVPVHHYHDGFGNLCSRILVPVGLTRIWANAIVNDSGAPDAVIPDAPQLAVEDLPDEVLVYLLASRYCDIDRLSDLAWSLFAGAPLGWGRVQAICDFVHEHIVFGYEHARSTRTAYEGHDERIGVCRDFAHLAVSLCRCMNIPARYCTGYLGDIGVPPVDAPMDFSAWFEAYLGDTWYTFDARHNFPRIGRVLIARGRDAADVAISTSFGPNRLAGFSVVTDEITPR
ncbi:MAG TPA: transglutaminase family protein [Stellaceae bacterium]|jgi:transglutaminase-like putative cysteine protease|nr:transglutaminase family protein [Stellaceae bacterium]